MEFHFDVVDTFLGSRTFHIVAEHLEQAHEFLVDEAAKFGFGNMETINLVAPAGILGTDASAPDSGVLSSPDVPVPAPVEAAPAASLSEASPTPADPAAAAPSPAAVDAGNVPLGS